MRDAIELIGKKVTLNEIEYKISNLNYMPDKNTFHVELESKKHGFTNVSLQTISTLLEEQIKITGIKKTKLT